MKSKAGLIRTLVCLGILCLTTQAWAQDAVVKKVIAEGTTNNQTQVHLDVLTNRIGGRPIGSPAYNAAVEWTASKFREWGYEVSVEEAGEVKVGFNRGPWFGTIYGAEMPNGAGNSLHFATPSYTAGTKGVQKGHVLIEPKTRAEFEAMRGVLKGAWVLVTGRSTGWPIDRSAKADRRRDSIIEANVATTRYNNEVMRRYRNSPNPTGVDRRRMTADDYAAALKDSLKVPADEPALFYREMVEAGVLGFIQSTPVPITALWDKETVNGATSSFDNLPSVPDIKLDETQYKVIYQLAKERRNIELEFEIRNHFTMGPVKYHNVVATLKGSKYPDLYIMASGHLDSYDVATGGVDCGVGVTCAMEAARLLSVAGAKPKQSIRFVLFAGEEFGLLGAEAYVKRHADELDKISNLFNRDGGPTTVSSVSVTENMYDDFVEASQYVNLINPDFPFKVNKSQPRPRPTSTGGTDASVFAIRGIPTITFSGGDPKGYNFSYGEIWHTERDTYSKSIAEYQEHVSVVQAVVMYGLSLQDHQLSREGMYTN